MTEYLKLLEEQRTIQLKTTEHLTTDQYNLVPPGFNNNIIWNMAHSLVVTESLLYSNMPFEIPLHEFDIEKFKIGTKPDRAITDTTISEIRQSMSDTVPLIRKLIAQGDSLHTLISEKSLRFILFHENMHFAKIQQLLQCV